MVSDKSCDMPLPGGMLFKQIAGKLVIKTPENIY
jgi:hypothetical protein